MLIVNNIVNFLVIINAAVNFILYSFMSSKFRRTFAHLLSAFRYRVLRMGARSRGGAGDIYDEPFNVSAKHRGSTSLATNNGAMLGRNRTAMCGDGTWSASTTAAGDGPTNDTSSVVVAHDHRSLLTPLPEEKRREDIPGNVSLAGQHRDRIIITVLAPSPEVDRLLSREVIHTGKQQDAVISS